MNDEQLLKKYKEALKVAWGYNDYDDWPIRVSSIMHLFADTFAQEFLEDMQKIWSEGKGAEKLGNLFRYPGRLFRLIDVVLFGLRRLRIPLQDQRQFIVRMIRAAAVVKDGDLFSKDGRNLLKQEHIPNDYCGNHETSLIVHKLQAALFLYTESTYFRGHDATKAVHGPYSSENKLIVFRRYHNLSPDSLWPKSMLLPIKKITTVCQYHATADIRVDCYDHIYHTGKLNDELIAWRIEIDGKVETDPKVLQDITEEAIEKARTISQMVDQWDWKKKAMKYAEIFWHRKAPLDQWSNRPNVPPDSVFDKIAQGEQNESRLRCLSPAEVARLIQLVV